MSTKVFSEYKNKHSNDYAFIFGSGPSLKDYLDSDFKTSEADKNIIKIGCNSALKNNLDIDYYFVGDPHFTGFLANPRAHLSPLVKKQKFCRLVIVPHLGDLVDDFKSYPTSRYKEKNFSYIPTDIEKEKINQVGTISMDMMQFAFHAGFKKIFLIGHDCNYMQKGKSSHFGFTHLSTLGQNDEPAHRVIRSWTWIKNYMEKSFPDVQVYVVNPVSLKLFPGISVNDIMDIIS
jgi:hypothetical protein